MVKLAEEKLVEARNQEAAFLIKQEKEAEEKAAEEERKKKERLEYLQKCMEDNRLLAEKLNKDKKKEEYEKNKKFQKLWLNKNKEIEAIEKAEYDETRRMNMNLAAFHKQQAKDKEKEREEQFIQEYQDAQTIKYSIMKEENDYMSYIIQYSQC